MAVMGICGAFQSLDNTWLMACARLPGGLDVTRYMVNEN